MLDLMESAYSKIKDRIIIYYLKAYGIKEKVRNQQQELDS